MKKTSLVYLLPLLLAGCHPSDSVREAFSSGNPPVLDTVSPHPGGIAEFRFHAADGNVVVLHREALNSAILGAPLDTLLDIDPAQQRAGALFTDRWNCVGEKGQLAIRAYLIDANHYHSNMVEYSIDCGG